MYKIAALAAVAAAIALPTSLTTSAQAGTRVTVSPVYVPAVYCSYKSAEWKTKGIVSCPLNWAPIGFPRHEMEDRGWRPDVLVHQLVWRPGISRLLEPLQEVTSNEIDGEGTAGQLPGRCYFSLTKAR